MVLDLSKVSACLVSPEPLECGILGTLGDFGEVIVGPGSFSVYGRYLAISQARYDVVYTQDDDCMVPVKELALHFDGRFVNNMEPGRLEFYSDGITLIGWGSFFRKELPERAFRQYNKEYPMDSFFHRLSDRIFTGLTPEKKTVCLPFTHLPKASAPNRMSAVQSHWDDLNEVRKRLAYIKEAHG